MHSVLGAGHVVAGRYRLVNQIGRGAMGIVWRGQDELLDREVAVKQIVHMPLASDAEATTSYQRTLREARAAARLSHPGVVTVFDVVESDGMPWIVMELVRARPLDQVIAEDGPLPPAQAAALGQELLAALAVAHAAGILHRDIKPSNVLIRPDGTAVLTDFGIATMEGDPGLTQQGMVVGTPGFAPPERVRGGPATPASDLWSLGATLYAAVEGRGPFDRAGGPAAIIASIATEPAPRAPSAGPLAPVIEALLRSDPADRPDAATTDQMLEYATGRHRAHGAVQSGVGAADGGAQTATAETGSSPAAKDELAAIAVGAGAELGATTATQVVTVPGAGGLHAAPQRVGQPGSIGADGPTTRPGGHPAQVVPDLMATPVFSDLRMPDAGSAPSPASRTDLLAHLGPAAPATSAAPFDQVAVNGGGNGQGPAEPSSAAPDSWRRRLLIPLAAAAAVALVAVAVWLAFPSQTNPGAASNLGLGPSGQGTPGGTPGQNGGHAKHGKHGSGRSSGPSAPGGSAKPSNGGPSGHPSPSGHASPSGSGSPSASPSPSPSPSPSSSGVTVPPGYAWWKVPSATVGTVAGFKLAGPASWLPYVAGLNCYLKPATGSPRLGVNLSAFTAAGPVAEAKHLQAVAIAKHKYRLYHLISITATTFRGRPAARWRFWWLPKGSLIPTDVTELLFTAQTPAGAQSYAIYMSAPSTRELWANTVLHIAMRTFAVVK